MSGEAGAHVGSADLSDACDRLGVPAVRTGRITPAYAGCPPVLGRVLTIALEPGAGDPIDDVVAACRRAPHDVVVVAIGGRLDVQCWGTVLATAAAAAGVGAAVVDGAVRDVEGLRRLGFPTFARGVHPASARGRLRFAGAGVEVEVDGGVVAPGWLAAADGDGVVLVPADAAADVVAAARRIAAAEAAGGERPVSRRRG